MTPRICKAARALLGLSQAELAGKAGVSERLVLKFEKGESVRESNVLKLEGALATLGVSLLYQPGAEGIMAAIPDPEEA